MRFINLRAMAVTFLLFGKLTLRVRGLFAPQFFPGKDMFESNYAIQ